MFNTQGFPLLYGFTSEYTALKAIGGNMRITGQCAHNYQRIIMPNGSKKVEGIEGREWGGGNETRSQLIKFTLSNKIVKPPKTA